MVVVNSKGNPRNFQGNLGEGEILYNLARYLRDILGGYLLTIITIWDEFPMVNRYKLPKYTSPEANMATQKMPSQKESSLPKNQFSGSRFGNHSNLLDIDR